MQQLLFDLKYIDFQDYEIYHLGGYNDLTVPFFLAWSARDSHSS